MTQAKMPLRLSLRPQYKGLPIPYTTFVDPNTGVPDFRVTNMDALDKCIEEGRCGLCGIYTGRPMYFIGGELCEENRLFFDPAMHLHCAEYAAEVCPFIALTNKGYSERALNPPDGFVHERSEHMSPNKTRMAIFVTDGFTTYIHDKKRYIRANPYIRVKWLKEGHETKTTDRDIGEV